MIAHNSPVNIKGAIFRKSEGYVSERIFLITSILSALLHIFKDVCVDIAMEKGI